MIIGVLDAGSGFGGLGAGVVGASSTTGRYKVHGEEFLGGATAAKSSGTSDVRYCETYRQAGNYLLAPALINVDMARVMGWALDTDEHSPYSREQV